MLSTQHQQRWNAAVKLFTKIKEIAAKQDAALMWRRGYYQPDQLVITDHDIKIIDGNCRFAIFVCDPEQDAGLYTTIPEFKQWVHENMMLVKLIKF